MPSNPRAWLTPDNAPAAAICWRVFSPGGEEWEAALRGALAPLADPDNWELYGSQTPDEAAQAFTDALALTYEWHRCMPIGSIIWFAGFTAPPHTLVCDGAEYQIADFPLLHAVINSNFGGDDINVFNVPDLRCRFPMGYNEEGDPASSIGSFGGEVNHTLTTNQIPSHHHGQDTHKHSIAPHTHTVTQATLPIVAAPGALPADGPSIPGVTGASAWQDTGYEGGQDTWNMGGGLAHNNMSPWLALNPLIVCD